MRDSKIKKDYVEVFDIQKPIFVVTLRDDNVVDTQYYKDSAEAVRVAELFELGKYVVDDDGKVEIIS